MVDHPPEGYPRDDEVDQLVEVVGRDALGEVLGHPAGRVAGRASAFGSTIARIT